MLPDGVEYEASWMDVDGKRCYQLMRTPALESLQPWIDAWSDLVEFHVRPVLTSAEYWSDHAGLETSG